MAKVAVIGGGVAGVSASLLLDEDITLFEKESSLISGPPFCHLHAGGNLYPQIPVKECVQLLKESINFLKLYPYSVDFRPTVSIFPKECTINLDSYINRLEVIKNEYKNLVKKDSSNLVLGEVENYYKLYSKENLLELSKKEIVKDPKSFDEWLINSAKYINLDAIKYPVVVVNEFGLNLFRLASGATLALNSKKNLNLLLDTKVLDVKRLNSKFLVTYEINGAVLQEKFDYLINAAGFKSGLIDDMLGLKRERLVEFKAAYVTKWQNSIKFPEIIFHGKRGTPKGMAQFTPYYGGYFQLHGMSKDITLFNNGLVKSSNSSSYPKLDNFFLDIIDFGWSEDIATLRTKKAIEHFKNFMPKFAKEATVTKKPLFGAQQIPGSNSELRAAEVNFEQNYARCEIVKVSSAINMAKEIAKEFNLKLNSNIKSDFNSKDITALAKEIAKSRDYPSELGEVVNSI